VAVFDGPVDAEVLRQIDFNWCLFVQVILSARDAVAHAFFLELLANGFPALQIDNRLLAADPYDKYDGVSLNHELIQMHNLKVVSLWQHVVLYKPKLIAAEF
jgi:hypothetical protein